MKPPFLRTAYNYDMNQASVDSGLKCEDPTLAQQQFLEECDINTIVERFGLSGEVPTAVAMPTYDDFSGVNDFQTAMNAVLDAQARFMELPAKVRSRFDNDPQKLLEFLAVDANREEAQYLGLLQPKAEAPKVEAPPSS